MDSTGYIKLYSLLSCEEGLVAYTGKPACVEIEAPLVASPTTSNIILYA
jgi:hypothetical protein